MEDYKGKEKGLTSSEEDWEAGEDRIGLVSLMDDDCNDSDDEGIREILGAYGPYGDSGLMVAIGQGKVNLAETMIESGADVNGRDYKGETALMKAATKGYYTCVQKLIAAGADVNTVNLCGDTALTIATLVNRS